jgi:hypothetical protein
VLAEFGFEVDSESTTELGELVMVKHLRGDRDASLDPLTFHKKYGPPAILLGQRAWAIPIEPRWHKQLFPDAPGPAQLVLPGLFDADPKPWGNALRKAYLCHSRVTKVRPGDTIVFYRSQDFRSFTVVGVVEATMRSVDPHEIMTFVGKRTVYTPTDIAQMCRHGPVFATLFRQDRFLDPAWPLAEVCSHGLLKSHPQSFTELRKGGISWLQEQLAEWP